MNRKTVLAGLTALALAAIGAGAPAASAAPCDGKDTEQPFLDWNDKAFYALVPGGDFEGSVDDWALDGGAALSAPGNPLRESSSAGALSLPVGSSATTPPVCVTKGNPSARIFARTLGEGEGSGGLKVEVVYLNRDREERKVKKAGRLKSEPVWDATRKFSLAQGQFGGKGKVAPDGTPKPCEGDGGSEQVGTAAKPCVDEPQDPKPCEEETEAKPCGGKESGDSYIKLRFTPLRGSAWEIDDVFVDPRHRI